MFPASRIRAPRAGLANSESLTFHRVSVISMAGEAVSPSSGACASGISYSSTPPAKSVSDVHCSLPKTHINSHVCVRARAERGQPPLRYAGSDVSSQDDRALIRDIFQSEHLYRAEEGADTRAGEIAERSVRDSERHDGRGGDR